MFNKRNTTILMTASAIVMAIIGAGTTFLPQEILGYLGITVNGITVLLVKIIGGLYVGLAALNWMARKNLIGGIYSRPVAVGNFTHFFIVTVVLFKHVMDTSHTAVISTMAITNAVFAISFTYILFGGDNNDGDGASCS